MVRILRKLPIILGALLTLLGLTTQAHGQAQPPLPEKPRIPAQAGQAAQLEGDLAAAYGAAAYGAAALVDPVAAPTTQTSPKPPLAPKTPARPRPGAKAPATAPSLRIAAKQTPKPGASHLVTLGMIDGESTDKLTLITIHLDRAPGWKGLAEIRDHGSFLQLTLPGTIVPDPGRFFDGGNPYLPKIAAFQLTPSDAGIRLFASRDAAKIKQALAVELLGDRIVVSLDHAKLTPLLEAAPAAAGAPTTAAVKAAPVEPTTPAASRMPAGPNGPDLMPAPRPAAAPSRAVAEAPRLGAATSTAVAEAPRLGAATSKVVAEAPRLGAAASKAVAEEPASSSPPEAALAAQSQDEALSADAATTAAATADGAATELPAAAVIAKTEVRHDIPVPSEQLRPDAGPLAAKATASAKKAGGGVLREKLVKVTLFSVTLLGLMGLSLLLRPILRRRAAAKGQPAAEFTMKTLASLPLAPKQRISLIQVGEERILIGISPEAVTFLTAIGRQPVMPAPASFQTLLTGLESREAAVELRQPVLKNLEGNDPKSLAAAPAARSPERRRATAPAAAEAAATPRGDGATPAARDGRRAPSAHGAPPKAQKPAPSRINLAVGEDGVQDLGVGRQPSRAKPAPAIAAEGEGEGQRAIDDVTRLIREKLKTLRTL